MNEMYESEYNEYDLDDIESIESIPCVNPAYTGYGYGDRAVHEINYQYSSSLYGEYKEEEEYEDLKDYDYDY